MAHNVETGVFYKQPTWWGSQNIVQDAMDSAAALKLAGLNWQVEKEPIYINGLLDEVVEVPGLLANVRQSDRSVLGIVSKDYKIIQNDEWFAFLDILLGEGLKFESAGSLFKGKQVWMLAKMPDTFKVAGDEFQQFLLATNSHDGKSVGRILCTDIRVVCWNTLCAALREAKRSWTIRHTTNLKGKEDEVRQHLKLANLYFNALQKKAEEMLKQSFNQEEWTKLVSKLLPLPEETTKRVEEGILEKRSRLFATINKDDLDNIRSTKWGAIQAVADYTTHLKAGRATSTWNENRMNKVLIQGEPMLKKAFELLEV